MALHNCTPDPKCDKCKGTGWWSYEPGKGRPCPTCSRRVLKPGFLTKVKVPAGAQRGGTLKMAGDTELRKKLENTSRTTESRIARGKSRPPRIDLTKVKKGVDRN